MPDRNVSTRGEDDSPCVTRYCNANATALGSNTIPLQQFDTLYLLRSAARLLTLFRLVGVRGRLFLRLIGRSEKIHRSHGRMWAYHRGDQQFVKNRSNAHERYSLGCHLNLVEHRVGLHARRIRHDVCIDGQASHRYKLDKLAVS